MNDKEQNFKVGDIVYYITPILKEKQYGVIKEVQGNKLWGHWNTNLKSLKEKQDFNYNFGFMLKTKCFILKHKVEVKKMILDGEKNKGE